jgi:hypothetical protein
MLIAYVYGDRLDGPPLGADPLDHDLRIDLLPERVDELERSAWRLCDRESPPGFDPRCRGGD